MAGEPIIITFENAENADLTELLIAFHNSDKCGGTDIVSLEAIQSETSFVGSGMPEIIQLIVALGSSGAIAAVTTILVKYFEKRPTGTFKYTLRTGSKQETIEIGNIDSGTAKVFLQNHWRRQ